FTKSKRMGPSVKRNAAYSIEDTISPSNTSGDKPMTRDQFHSLYHLLQQMKIGTEGQQSSEDTTTANNA
ncbi:hypothetical protein HAX54_018028, partial [Datura stramonium]|nr:hypothetical protein [Datura stramonium]